MASGDVLPRFFSVYLSLYSSESFLIPSSYYEHLPRPLPKTAILMGDGGKIWQVAMTSRQDHVYFEQGWSSFVTDNDLKDGEFLTFVFDGYQRFQVSTYGLGGCKEIRAVVEVEEISEETRAVAETVEISGSDSEEEEEEEELSMDVDDDSSFQAFDDEESNSDAADFAANINVESLTNPHFTTTLKNRINELWIPANLVKQNNLKFGDSVKYIDEEGTLIGKRAKYSDGTLRFKGWNRICRRNKLKKNEDKVKCELIHDQNNVHSIRIHVIQRAT